MFEKNKFDIKTLEKNMLQESLETEKRIALEALKNISSAFKKKALIINGVQFKRIVRSKEVTIGRVTVKWERPIYEGSKSGKTVYFYPADDCLKPPKKTKQSYWNLSIVALLGSFIPYKLVAYIMKVLCGTRISESSVQRYTETVGQFAKENMAEIVENRVHLSNLGKDEILIISIDGTSSMINGNNKDAANGKKKKKKKKKDISSRKKKKRKKSKGDGFLKEAKVFRVSVYNTQKSKIVRTLLIHSTIKQKEEVYSEIKYLFDCLKIPQLVRVYAIGDGAPWVKDVLMRIHPKVEFLLDYYHLSGYVSKVSELKFFRKQKQGQPQGRKYRKSLKKKGGRKIVKDLINLAATIISTDMTQKEIESDLKIIDEILKYLEPRLDDTDYTTAQVENRPIGSGFIESACKLIVKQRLCFSGARFSYEDAERIMQLRSIIYMDAWDDLVDLMYEKEFEICHPQPSSSYQPIVNQKIVKLAA